MYQAAEGKVPPKREKIKTADHTILELLHRVEASAEVGVVFYPHLVISCSSFKCCFDLSIP
ncbi:unnamed protein product [marine sediment metagenome]|uniref:Uncharacterized protein n=1 Tax=marine sediment metagenome TaxID=412755 RepID=X1TT53_9ZZZZ